MPQLCCGKQGSSSVAEEVIYFGFGLLAWPQAALPAAACAVWVVNRALSAAISTSMP
jgi:hypothetical protein